MACSGCAQRREMLRQALDDARKRNVRGAMRKVAQTAHHMSKDAVRVMRSPLAGKRK